MSYDRTNKQTPKQSLDCNIVFLKYWPDDEFCLGGLESCLKYLTFTNLLETVAKDLHGSAFGNFYTRLSCLQLLIYSFSHILSISLLGAFLKINNFLSAINLPVVQPFLRWINTNKQTD